MDLPGCVQVARPIADMEFPVDSNEAAEIRATFEKFEKVLRAIGNGFPQSDLFLELLIDQTSAIAIHLVELAQVEEWNPAKLGLQLLTIVQWAR